MKTVLIITLLAAGTAHAQFSKLRDLIKQQQQREEQAPGSSGYRPAPAQEERDHRDYRHDDPRWQPQHPVQPDWRPGSSGGLPGSYPGGTREVLPQIDPRYRPAPRPDARPLPEDEIFDNRRDERKSRSMQELVKEAKERYAREKELERSIPPGINLPQKRLPIQRPERTRLPEQSMRIWQNYTNNWSQWTIERNADINLFSRQRSSTWQRIDSYRSSDRCWHNYGREDWWQWRGDIYNFRTQRCYELWNSSYWIAGQLFDTHWWSYCRWAGRPVPAQTPAWWWFQPTSWESIARLLRLSRPEMLLRDPGVDVLYWGDRVFINGKDAGSAEKHRKSGQELAAKDWGWEPPFSGGRFDWMPLGVWALTPQEYGEATMFFQLALSREGLITGAYTNILTGEEAPVMGRADWKQQRAAWRIGSSTSTVIETGLCGFTWDVAGAFVHFGRGGTQLWQLTRLPSPGSQPGPVRLPRGRY